MSGQADNTLQQLKSFGLTQEEAEIYLLLLKNQPLTALRISRELHFARTRVYRMLDKLSAKGLVNQKLESRGLAFSAASPQQLELLIKEKEDQLQGLKNTFSSLVQELSQLEAQGKNDSKVLYYTGVEGLKQVQWNSLQADKILRIYEIKNMAAFLPVDFCEKVRHELAERKIFVREITNQTRVEDWTAVGELVTNFWQVKSIPKSKINIKFEVLIYNDVYAMYSTHATDIFCVEIYNKDLAIMQKQLFDFVWNSAIQMKIISDKGVATV